MRRTEVPGSTGALLATLISRPVWTTQRPTAHSDYVYPWKAKRSAHLLLDGFGPRRLRLKLPGLASGHCLSSAKGQQVLAVDVAGVAGLQSGEAQ